MNLLWLISFGVQELQVEDLQVLCDDTTLRYRGEIELSRLDHKVLSRLWVPVGDGVEDEGLVLNHGGRLLLGIELR
jgi:hypothetical protein